MPDDDGSEDEGGTKRAVPTSGQFTPDVDIIIEHNKQPTWLSGGGGSTGVQIISAASIPHDPDTDPTDWTGSEWDGIPFPGNWETATKEELCAFAFPLGHGNAMLGLREKFYQLNPFADTNNPTVVEIEDWNIAVIEHFRSLFGIDTPIEKDRCLYVRALWADERKYTDYWDTAYPSGGGSPPGPICCPSGVACSTDAHCGDIFYPLDYNDQLPYFTGSPEPEPGCPWVGGGSTGIITTSTKTTNWVSQLSRVIKNWVCSEGQTGHAGPFFTRTKVGMSWLVFNSGAVQFRGKWAG